MIEHTARIVIAEEFLINKVFNLIIIKRRQIMRDKKISPYLIYIAFFFSFALQFNPIIILSTTTKTHFQFSTFSCLMPAPYGRSKGGLFDIT